MCTVTIMARLTWQPEPLDVLTPHFYPHLNLTLHDQWLFFFWEFSALLGYKLCCQMNYQAICE